MHQILPVCQDIERNAGGTCANRRMTASTSVGPSFHRRLEGNTQAMTTLTKRFSKSKLPDSTEMRERILEAVEQAIDRVEDVVKDAPSPKEAADNLRKQRIVRSAGTTMVAIAPAVARAARNRRLRGGSRRAALAAPFALRTHPVLMGVGVAATALTGALLLKRALSRFTHGSSSSDELQEAQDRSVEEFDPTGFSLDEEVERMEDEGGEPGTGSAPSDRRFVGSNGQRATRS